MLQKKGNFLHSHFVRLIVFLLISLAHFNSNANLIKVDFDQSMGIEEKGRFNLMFNDPERSDEFYHFYKNLYNQNILSKDIDESIRIPKLIHQIWVGPKPFPDLYKKYAETCQVNNPEWEYKLWSNEDVESILATNPKYKSLYKEYKKYGHFSGQKDILEYLILYKYGGVFLDADIECKKSFSEMQRKYDFFLALEPGHRFSGFTLLTNAFVGSKKNNPIFIDSLDLALKKYNIMFKDSNTDYRILIRKIKRFFGQNIKDIRVPDQRVVLMFSLGENLVKNNHIYNKNAIVLPATYVNPVMRPAKRYNIIDEIKYKLGIYKNKGETFTEVKPETIAVQDFYD